MSSLVFQKNKKTAKPAKPKASPRVDLGRAQIAAAVQLSNISSGLDTLAGIGQRVVATHNQLATCDPRDYSDLLVKQKEQLAARKNLASELDVQLKVCGLSFIELDKDPVEQYVMRAGIYPDVEIYLKRLEMRILNEGAKKLAIKAAIEEAFVRSPELSHLVFFRCAGEDDTSKKYYCRHKDLNLFITNPAQLLKILNILYPDGTAVKSRDNINFIRIISVAAVETVLAPYLVLQDPAVELRKRFNCKQDQEKLLQISAACREALPDLLPLLTSLEESLKNATKNGKKKEGSSEGLGFLKQILKSSDEEIRGKYALFRRYRKLLSESTVGTCLRAQMKQETQFKIARELDLMRNRLYEYAESQPFISEALDR